MLENWISLYTDGVVQVEFGKAVVGKVWRNGNREWIMGYNRHLGVCFGVFLMV